MAQHRLFRLNERTIIIKEGDTKLNIVSVDPRIDTAGYSVELHNINKPSEVFTMKFDEILDNLGAQVDPTGTDIGTVLDYVTTQTAFKSASGSSEAEIIAAVSKYTGHASYTDDLHVDQASAFTVPANTDTVFPLNAGTIYDDELPIDRETFYYHGKLNIISVSGSFQKGETITGATSGATAVIMIVGGSYLLLKKITGSFLESEIITAALSTATATIDGSPIGSKITGKDGDNLDLMLYFKCVPSINNQKIDIWIDIGGSVGELYRKTIQLPKSSGEVDSILYSLPSAYTRGTWELNGGTLFVRSSASFDIFKSNLNADRSHKAKSA